MNLKGIWRKNNNLEKVQDLMQQLVQIRSKSSILVIVPDTTGYSWMGVNRATLALFPYQSIVLPQYYSNSLFSEEETEKLQKIIRELSFSQLIFSGFPSYFGTWMKNLKVTTNQIGLIYHGFFSELAGNPKQIRQLTEIITLNKLGIIDKIAFNKKGMGESLMKLWQIEAHKIIVSTPLLQPQTRNKNGFHIGVLGNDQFRKNIHNQVVAASMISNSMVHVTSDTTFDYLPNTSIVPHPSAQSHEDFTKLLGSMHINLHLSYSESWGQLTTESLVMGVPCLVSYHSDVFDYDDELKNQLVVHDYDNSYAIYKQILQIKEDETLSEKCRNYITILNKQSEMTISKFLEA